MIKLMSKIKDCSPIQLIKKKRKKKQLNSNKQIKQTKMLQSNSSRLMKRTK